MAARLEAAASAADQDEQSGSQLQQREQEPESAKQPWDELKDSSRHQPDPE